MRNKQTQEKQASILLRLGTRQHDVVPDLDLVSDVTHVALAFMPASIFNDAEPASWPLFTTVSDVREKFPAGTAIMVAVGGWGDTSSFRYAAATPSSRVLFASNMKAMVDDTGADGECILFVRLGPQC